MTRVVGVVADDLTGAMDTAVQFSRRGWPTLVALDPSRARTTEAAASGVLAVVTDARAAEEEVAATRTAAMVREVVAAGVTSLYVKVDSTLRGSVAAQIRGAVQAWETENRGAFAVVCPSYPAMGRTVDHGVAALHGRPLEEGPAGRDPVTPVRTSAVDRLVKATTHLPRPAHDSSARLADALDRTGSPGAVVTVDAVDGRDLQRIAEAVALLGRRVVPVGSAGLASSLAAAWTPQGERVQAENEPSTHRGPVAVLVTSVHQVAREQQRRLVEEYGERVLALSPPLHVLLHQDHLRLWFGHRCGRRRAEQDIVLVSAPDTELSGAQRAPDVAASLAECVALLHARHGLSGVVVTGGDGARALVNRWDCAGIAVRDALREGMPHGVLVGGSGDGLPIVTKAGGFGDVHALVHAVGYTVARGPQRHATTSGSTTSPPAAGPVRRSTYR